MNDSTRLRRLIDGYRGTALLHAACKLGLPDRLAGGALSLSDLADAVGVPADALRRLLRGLEVLGVVSEEAGGGFALTSLGSGLVSSAPGGLGEAALLAGEEYAPAWGALHGALRAGEVAFEQVFGVDAWTHRRLNPDLDAAFQIWLREATSRGVEAIVRACDFADVRVVADVGGGQGGLLAAILQAHSRLRGLLIDQAAVVERAGSVFEAAGLAARCELRAGDFFSALPDDADCYLLKSVLHDWDDERCVAILRTVRRALRPGARLLVVERPLPVRACDDPTAVMLDLHMLAVLGGRERPAARYREMAAEAGLDWRRDVATDAGFLVMEFGPGGEVG